MAIEIESKTQKGKGNLVKYTLYGGVALLLIMAVSYAFLYFSVNRAEKKLSELGQQKQISEEDKALEEKIVQTQKQLERSEQVIDSHRSVYNFLATLESTTHPHLEFTQMDLNARLSRIKLNGITEGFTTLGQQVKALQRKSEIEKVKVEKAQVESGGKISFNIVLTVNSNIFKFPPQ